MYITETKLLIDEIDTPILKTNGLFVKGRALHKALFQGEYHTIKADVVEELIKNGATNTASGGAEQILGFSMTVYPQFDNMPLQSVTLRRRDTTGTANCLSTPLYMYIDCYVGNELVKTIYSDNNVQQVASDNLQTTWYFTDSEFRLSQSFSRVQFRFTQQKGSRQNKTARSSYMGSQSNKLYIEGWKTMYPNQSAGNEWRNFSTNFYINVKKGYSGIQQHIDNDVIHFTEENKQQLNQQYEELNTAFEDHVDNDVIHVTAQEKQKINSITGDLGDLNGKLVNLINAHKTQEGLHWTVDDRIKFDKFNKHITSTNIHVTAEEKEKWNNIVIPEIPEIPEPITYTAGNGIEITDNTISVITTDVIEESDKIPTTKALYNIFYGTRTFNNYDSSKYTEAADTVGTIVLSKKHFIKDCKITKISLPHDKNIDNGEGGYLVIEVFAEDLSNTDGYDKANPIHRYYSDNYYAYKMNTQNGKYEWTFNNTECLIPSDYKVVHLSLVTNDTIVPSIGSTNNNKLRINCLAKNGNRDEGVVYEEDDECTLYWQGSTSGANRVAIVQVEYIGNKLDDFSIVPMLLERIAALEARVNELENS